MPLSFVENPQSFRFEDQDPDETVILVVRAHPITNLSWLVPAVLLFLLPFAVALFESVFKSMIPPFPEVYKIAFLVVDYLLALIITFEGFLYWYFNVNIITNERILDVNFASLLYKNIDMAPINKVEEANTTMSGVLGSILNFGDVSVQTAGAVITIKMEKIPKPNRVANLILETAEERAASLEKGEE